MLFDDGIPNKSMFESVKFDMDDMLMTKARHLITISNGKEVMDQWKKVAEKECSDDGLRDLMNNPIYKMNNIYEIHCWMIYEGGSYQTILSDTLSKPIKLGETLGKVTVIPEDGRFLYELCTKLINLKDTETEWGWSRKLMSNIGFDFKNRSDIIKYLKDTRISCVTSGPYFKGKDHVDKLWWVSSKGAYVEQRKDSWDEDYVDM